MDSINQDDANTISPEAKAQFSSFIEPFFSQYHRERCYLGLKFQQGKRTMLQINVPASDFSGLLQAKPLFCNISNPLFVAQLVCRDRLIIKVVAIIESVANIW